MLAICPFCRARQEVPDPAPAAGVTCIGCHRRFAARRTAAQPAAAPAETAILRIERPHGVFDRPAVVAQRVAAVATAAAPLPRADSAPEDDPGPPLLAEPDAAEERAAQAALSAIRRQIAATPPQPAQQAQQAAQPAPLPDPTPEAPTARRIGVMLSKGGVGKTTTAVNLAAALAMAGRRTLLIDADTQGQAAYALGVSPQAGLTEFVEGLADADEALCPARDNLWLLAGGKALAGLKRLITRKDFGGERTLADALAPLDARFDVAVVDCAPGWDALSVNVLFYVGEVLVPVALEAMSLQGFSEFLQSFAAVSRYRPELSLSHIVPTFLDKRVRGPAALHDELAALYPGRICPPIRYNVKLSEAPAEGKTIFEYAPRSPGARDYAALARHVGG
ncbi:ParA family protein [Solidesulfovibrio alcoholivorans]|uniref:ParA family protein n=1 Tax=Solidesulfovibrio alcoholivorans TaxID=81406 RepID=UPI00049749ED|nr:ParA family protein [Solidesulfovibrio alcoholivorans]